MRWTLLLGLLLGAPAAAQNLDTLYVDLEALEVTATRLTETAATAPFSVALEVRSPLERTSDPGASLETVLRHLPGLWVRDRENFSLGERLSVRGMGARAGFGVRGVQVVLDGIPLTLADGQAPLTIVDPSLVRRAELVRGPASAAWGNGSGGVLFLSTVPEHGEEVQARIVGGSYGLLRAEAEGHGTVAGGRAGLALSHVRREGYRLHSAFEVTRARAFYAAQPRPGLDVRGVAALEWAPFQQHPGALTAEEFAADPRQAQTLFVDRAAGKDSRQLQAGLALRAATPLGTLRASSFGLVRRLDNPLPFAYIDVARTAGGLRLALEREDGPLRWTLGADANLQRDDRQNWVNQAGERGDLRLDQLETVTNAAAFAQGAYRLGALTLSAGLRHDRTRFAADDRFLADGDASGSRTLAAWSPSAGLSLRLGPALFFASASTAFETPTTTELVNRPDGGGGFNPDLRPQRTRGLEAGVRGTDRAGRLYVDLAVYRLAVEDQLTPFQGPDGRTFFRNVEGARHDGLELALEGRLAPGLRLGGTYAWSRFAFTEDAGTLAGNRLPGVPEHRGTLRAELARGPAFVHLSALLAGPVWTDDANTTRADGFVTADLRAGLTGLAAGRALVQPFVQIQNLTDARYAGSINPNATAGRYFEPAAGRSVQAGLSVRVVP